MPVIARDKLIETLQLSGLVEEGRLSRFLAEQEIEVDAEFLLQKMVDSGLVTPWQSEGLVAGKWKGYFLGKYRLLSPLGKGAMGSVYLAEHKVMRHRVAIKVLAKHLMATPNIVARFEREARAAALINHPNVVRAYDVDNDGSVHFLVMEYVQGDDLKKIVEQSGPLDPRVAAEYIQQVARGLHEAHQNGLIHRDIKPANLLVDQSGLVKILDLGLARLEDDATSVSLNNESRVLGTVDYLAPEQARNSHTIDGRADLYSLGCTLYFLLTGVPPFPTGSIAERMLKHQTRRPVDIRKRRPGVPDALVTLCSRLMEKKADKRFATAGEAATAFGDFLDGRYDTDQRDTDDDFLTFAEDADTGGSGIARQANQSSNLTGRSGGGSTAGGAAKSSNTVPDDLGLAPDPSASKSSKISLTPEVVTPLAAEVMQPVSNADFGLTPLAAGDVANPLEALLPLNDALPGLPGGNPLDFSDPLSSPLLGAALNPLSPVRPRDREPGEVHYPLWVLLGIGAGLGLVVGGVALLLYFLFR